VFNAACGERRLVVSTLPRKAVALFAGITLVVAACADVAPTNPLQGMGGGWNVVPADAMSLSISNGTTLTVTLLVNGQLVRSVGPGAVADAFPASTLPGLPWAIEARTSSGRLLISLTIKAGDVLEQPTLGGFTSKGPWTQAVLSCGRLDVWSWSGSRPPPPPGPASESPGNCAP
jgi:hypothetical protein